ncbi:MAG: ABC transporter permease [Clostridia bacterium]|nr:ABC transporter permease [Clostridia bacterium]MBQ1942465.1 ABC transporter permease [Clostridia bacterium]
MKQLLAVIKKEFARFFKDKRMLATVLLPGVLIYFVYSFMGSGIGSQMQGSGEPPVVYAENLPEPLAPVFESFGWEIQTANRETAFEEIKQGKADLYMAFPKDFIKDLATVKTQNVSLYYNSAEVDSSTAYTVALAAITAFEDSIINLVTVNGGEEIYDLATEKDVTGMIMSTVIPMVLMALLFSGCMAVAPESISGEKERGTIATLLVTPIKRGTLALGKVLSLSAIACLSALSSFLGLILSFPKLMGESGIDMNVYGPTDYLLIFAVLLSTVLVITGIIAAISTFAKSVKEATSYSAPLMILVLVISMLPMFVTLPQTLALALIPLYNSVQCFGSVFAFTPNPVYIVITICSNFVYAALLVILVAKMFASEKIMFSK